MTKIALEGRHGRGLFAIVDAGVARIARRYRWLASKKQSGMYAVTYIKRGAGFSARYLHQLVMPDAPAHVDHRNGNTLDCRRRNLRLASTKQNVRNSRKWRRKTTSIYKGVYYDGVRRGRVLSKPWRARIKVDYRGINIGRFATQREAAVAYDIAARKHFGEFAALNFPRRGEGAAHGRKG